MHDDQIARRTTDDGLSSTLDGEERGCMQALRDGSALMLDLSFKNGDRLALPYSYLNMVRWSRESGIVLEFPTVLVTITGSNFLRLYNNLLMHRVFRLCEAETMFDGDTKTVIVQAIGIESREAESSREVALSP